MKNSDMNRRRFLKAGAMGIVGAGALAKGQAFAGSESDKQDNSVPRVVKYNTLGKTGLKVSDISLGGAREEAVLRYALDLGVNLIDTAEVYYEGQHEMDVGKAFKPVRDKVHIITKHVINTRKKNTRKKVIKRFDESLKRLQTDYVDIAMWHVLDDPKVLKDEEVLRAYEDLKKAGKYRHLGFSTHKPELSCQPCFDSGLFSCMMIIYNSVQYPDRSELITKAKELGIGVIAMKTMMGREQDKIAELVDDRTTFAHAAMKWALTDKAVNSVVITMRTFEHIEEYLKASGKSLNAQDQAVLKKYVKAVDDRYCRIGCVACAESCPHKVAVNDIMRFGMYYENYHEEKKAMQEYAALDRGARAHHCEGCPGNCESACPHKLTIRDRLMRYDGLLRI